MKVKRVTLLAMVAVVVMTQALVAASRVELVAGGGTGGPGSKATEVRLGSVFGVDQDAAGNLYLIEHSERLWRIRPDGVTELMAGKAEPDPTTLLEGNAAKGKAKKAKKNAPGEQKTAAAAAPKAIGDNGPAKDAVLSVPHAVAVHRPSGDVYVADTGHGRVRRIDSKSGVITTFAGGGTVAASAGRPVQADQIRLGGVYCIAFSPDFKTLVITDLDNKQVLTADVASRQVTLVAGNGEKAPPADGADAKSAPLNDPRAAAMDGSGNVYILERGGHTLRVVDPAGKIRAVAGNGQKGAGGDGGPALQASLNGPKHLWIEPDGNVLIADSENHKIRRVDVKAGTIVTIAGTGEKGSAGVGGDPKQVQLDRPHGIFRAPDGTLYISDSSNRRVLKISP